MRYTNNKSLLFTNRITTPHHIIQSVKETYEQIAPNFAQTRLKKMWKEIHELTKLVKPEMKVLDVGCGNGRLVPELPDNVFYTGMDFSSALINEAKTRFPDKRFLERDITTEEGWANIASFDAVFCVAVLHHIPDRQRQHELLQQMFLHTKPGGFAVISIWNLWNIRFWRYHLMQVGQKIKHKNWSYVWVPFSSSDGTKATKTTQRFCKAYLPHEIIGLIKQVGFQIDTYYFARNGKTHLHIFDGANFVIYARRPEEK